MFSSPSSFDDAWNSEFFDKESKDALSSLGFVVDDIPDILANPLGGRLKYCAENWKLIGASDWVQNVVSEGYKIPFENFPSQHFVPENPEDVG